MKLMRTLELLALASILCLLAVSAADARTWTVEYNEPTTNEAGTVLGSVPGVTLSKTQIKPIHNGTAMTPIDVPATKPTGGGKITRTITTPDTGVCVDDKMEVSVTAWNAVKEGKPTPSVSKIDVKVTSDPCQTPAAPSDLKLTLNP